MHFYIKVCLPSSFAEHRNKAKDLFARGPGLGSDGRCRSVPFSQPRPPSLCREHSRALTSSSELQVSCCTEMFY